MDSLTKNHQNEEAIRKMVRNAFEPMEATKVTELKEGYFNVAYLIMLSNGQEVILKIAPPKNANIMSYEKNLMLAEVKSMRLVRETTTVPAPDVLYYSEENEKSCGLCDSPYFFMTKIEGSNYHLIKDSLTEGERNHIDYELGQYNREMNDVIGNNYGYFAQELDADNDWKTTFQRMIHDVIQDGRVRNIDIGMDYEILLNTIASKLVALESVKISKFVHWDLWDGNVFVKDGHVEGIIDYERALWGDTLMEYAFRNHNMIGKQSSFLSGYGQIEQNQDSKVRCVLYDIYLYLIMTIECDYRQYADDGQYNWAKNMLSDAVKRLEE